MDTFDRAWFIATLFGVPYAATLTDAEYEFAYTLAESELASVLCWCPKLYPTALSIKIAILLSGSGLGTGVAAPPVVGGTSPSVVAYVQEDEVFDVRRRYKFVDQTPQLAESSPAAQLAKIIDACKPPLAVGAFLAGGISRALGGARCCSPDPIGDKAEWNHGGQ